MGEIERLKISLDMEIQRCDRLIDEEAAELCTAIGEWRERRENGDPEATVSYVKSLVSNYSGLIESIYQHWRKFRYVQDVLAEFGIE